MCWLRDLVLGGFTMATITRNNDDDDDEDFCFKRPSVRKSSNTTTKQIRQPVEHDEETSQVCRPTLYGNCNSNSSSAFSAFKITSD